MTTRQPRKAPSSWLTTLAGVAASFAATWGLMVHFLQPAVNEAVNLAVQAEFKKQSIAARHFADSANVLLLDSMRMEIRCVAQDFIDSVGLIAMEQDGKTVYSPRIVVQADTMGLKLVNARLDTLGREVDGLNSSVNFIVNLPLFQAARPAHNRRPK